MRKYDNISNYNPLDREIFNSGSYGVIYDNGDGTLIKVMRSKTLNPYAILKIKELNLDNFYHLYNILVEKKNDKEYLSAYQMEKVIEDDTNILVDNNYLISNIKILINSFNTLSENYILVDDLHEENMIISKEGIKIIDCDKYHYSDEYSIEAIKKYNLEELKNAIYYLLKNQLKDKKRFSFIKQKRLKELFSLDDLDNIINELNNYDSVMEYVKKKK